MQSVPISAERAVTWPHMDATKQLISTVPLDDASALLGLAAQLLYANGEATRSLVAQVEELGRSIGYSAALFPSWAQLIIRLQALDETKAEKILVIESAPVGVDMNIVMKTRDVLDDVSARRLEVGGAISALKEAARLPPASSLRFAALAGAGAA